MLNNCKEKISKKIALVEQISDENLLYRIVTAKKESDATITIMNILE